VGEERFAAIARPFHRPPDAARRPHHRDLLRIDIEARSERAADIWTDHVNALLLYLEASRERMPQTMRALTSRNQRMLLLRRVIAADGRARLQERAGGALVADRLLDDDVRVLDDGLHGGAVAEGAVELEIVGGARPDRRRSIREPV